MGNIRKITAALLLILLAGMLAFPAAATAVEHDGLEITVEMDKDSYQEGEAITATITVTNVSSQTITIVNLEQLIPDGYRLSEDSNVAMKDVHMLPGQILVLEVTFEGDPNAQSPLEEEELVGFEAFVHTVLYGRTLGVPNMLIATVAVIAIVVFFILT